MLTKFIEGFIKGFAVGCVALTINYFILWSMIYISQMMNVGFGIIGWLVFVAIGCIVSVTGWMIAFKWTNK